ncbi:MAG: thioredoxin domain-containing protein [Christensenellales bacterium]|jgi:thiol-disulfide isomerase/thioredoxin
MSVTKRMKDRLKNEMLMLDKPVSADFWDSWRELCRMMTPVLDELAKELSSQSKDIEQKELATELCVQKNENMTAFSICPEVVILNILEE